MRVISGERRGAKLIEIEGEDIRPTTDRVKENIFNLMLPFRAKAVLDLFAGTGAMGIEAISRGATNATFVDISVNSLSVCKQNLEKFCMTDRSEIVKKSFDEYLGSYNGDKFDLIFLDPPYNKGYTNKSIKMIKQNNLLSENGIIVAECDSDEEIEESGFSILKERKYGRTKVFILSN